LPKHCSDKLSQEQLSNFTEVQYFLFILQTGIRENLVMLGKSDHETCVVFLNLLCLAFIDRSVGKLSVFSQDMICLGENMAH